MKRIFKRILGIVLLVVLYFTLPTGVLLLFGKPLSEILSAWLILIGTGAGAFGIFGIAKLIYYLLTS